MPVRVLTPLALLQGLWVKARTPRLPPARGRRGRFGSAEGAALLVAGVGDSIIAGTGVADQRQALTGQFARRLHERSGRTVEWCVHGFNGATSSTVLRRIAPHAPHADVYLVSAGVNDAVRGISARDFGANLRALLRLLRDKSPGAAIIFSGLPPLQQFPALPWPLGALLAERARALQAAAHAVGRDDGRMVCFDFDGHLPRGAFASDGFHPAADACGDWAEGLLQLWPGPARPARS